MLLTASVEVTLGKSAPRVRSLFPDKSFNYVLTRHFGNFSCALRVFFLSQRNFAKIPGITLIN